MAEEPQTEVSTEVSSQASEYKDEKAVYEVGFHVVSTISEEEASKVMESVRAELKKAGSEIISESSPKKMTLAYTVERAVSGSRNEKHRETYFGWIKFEALPETIPPLQTVLRGMPEILRFLLIETVREDITAHPRKALFTSDRLEGKTIERRPAAPEKGGQVSDEELDKSIEALVS